jgi:DNA-binding HxlR family transcriptional regulator
VAKDENLEILRSLMSKYSFGILRALSQKEMRFAELKDAVPNERTRSLNLKNLGKSKLVTKTAFKRNSEIVVIYKITRRGRNFLQELGSLLKYV